MATEPRFGMEMKLTPSAWVPLGVSVSILVAVVAAAVSATQWATRLESQLINIAVQIEEVKRHAATPKDRYTCTDHIRFVRQLKALNPRLTMADPASDCSVRDIP